MNIEAQHLQKQNLMLAAAIVSFTLFAAWVMKMLELDADLIKTILNVAFGLIVGVGFNTSKKEL